MSIPTVPIGEHVITANEKGELVDFNVDPSAFHVATNRLGDAPERAAFHRPFTGGALPMRIASQGALATAAAGFADPRHRLGGYRSDALEEFPPRIDGGDSA